MDFRLILIFILIFIGLPAIVIALKRVISKITYTEKKPNNMKFNFELKNPDWNFFYEIYPFDKNIYSLYEEKISVNPKFSFNQVDLMMMPINNQNLSSELSKKFGKPTLIIALDDMNQPIYIKEGQEEIYFFDGDEEFIFCKNFSELVTISNVHSTSVTDKSI